MSYVYIKTEENLWTVGFYDPKGKWVSESDHNTLKSASKRVHWLMGEICTKIVTEVIEQRMEEIDAGNNDFQYSRVAFNLGLVKAKIVQAIQEKL